MDSVLQKILFLRVFLNAKGGINQSGLVIEKSEIVRISVYPLPFGVRPAQSSKDQVTNDLCHWQIGLFFFFFTTTQSDARYQVQCTQYTAKLS
jgi:hypothetical protein